jgi:hypothetical protein
LTQLVVGEVDGDEPVGGVQNGQVETELVKALVEQPRQHGGGPVESIAGRYSPPGRLDDPMAPAHFVAHSLERLAAVHNGVEALGHRLASEVDEQVPNKGQEFDQVTVAVDDRMVELVPDAPNPVRRLITGHVPLPPLTRQSYGIGWSLQPEPLIRFGSADTMTLCGTTTVMRSRARSRCS